VSKYTTKLACPVAAPEPVAAGLVGAALLGAGLGDATLLGLPGALSLAEALTAP
jgi:hypothetical protein